MNSDNKAPAVKFVQNIKSALPCAHIYAVSHDGQTISTSDTDVDFPTSLDADRQEYKSITTVIDNSGKAFYRIHLPIRSLFSINIYVPTNFDDILTVAKIAESIVHYSYSVFDNDAVYSRLRNINMLLDRILHKDMEEADVYSSLLAADLGFDMSIQRSLLVIHFYHKVTLENGDNNLFSPTRKLLKVISSDNSQNIAGFFGGNNLVICRAVNKNEPLCDFINALTDCIGEGTKYFIVHGASCSTITDYADSFQFISTALVFAEQYVNTGRYIFEATDFLAEYIVASTPDSALEHFYKRELNYAHITPWFIETLQALVDNDMEICAASKCLFIHRNTMVFRVNQIRKKLGIDPINDDRDRFRIIIFCRWQENLLNQRQ